jgi:hypothetical protein
VWQSPQQTGDSKEEEGMSGTSKTELEAGGRVHGHWGFSRLFVVSCPTKPLGP